MNKINSKAAGSPAGGDETTPAAGAYKILRPARERADWPPVPPKHAAGLRQICLIDVETVGLDWRRHPVIEVCAARVQVDALGRIAGTGSVYSRFFYQEKDGRWNPLGLLRNARIAKREQEIAFNLWQDLLDIMRPKGGR